MAKKKYSLNKEFIMEMVGLPFDADDGVIIYDKIIENSRWSILHELVFCWRGNHYMTSYSVGATEMQYERPWEYDDKVDCYKVTPVEKTIIVWETVDV